MFKNTIWAFVLTVVWTHICLSSGQKIWTSCSRSSNSLRITNLDIAPNPVYMPGNIYFTLAGYSSRTIGSSRLILNIVREGSWFNIPIPCIRKIGSCTYRDMCTMLDDMVTQDWLGITHKLGQTIQSMLTKNGLNPGLCPQPPGMINVTRNVIELPKMPAALYWFAEGIYAVNLRVIDNSNNEELVCLNMRLNIKQNHEGCTGWFGC